MLQMTTSSENTAIGGEICFVFNKSCKKKDKSFSFGNNLKFHIYCENFKKINNETYTMLYLYFSNADGGSKSMSIRYQYSIEKIDGDRIMIQCGKINFPAYTDSRRYGGHCLINEKYLSDEANDFITRNNIRIFCEIEEIQNQTPDIQNLMYIDHYQKQFQQLLESGKFSDVTLVVGEKELYAHKNILAARSKVFEAMFEHDCEENRKNRVDIIDMSLDVCEQLLGYIYSGENPQMKEYAMELFVVADKYQLELLRSTCEDYLKSHISIETVSNVLVLANMLGAENLETKCIDYITENSSKVKSTDGWKIIERKPDLLTKLFFHISSKYESGNKQVESKRLKIFQYQEKIAFSTITMKFIAQLKQDYGALLKSGKLSDAVLLVGKKEIPVHKNILSSRSKVFAELFSQNNRVQVAIGISVFDCETMLRYLYTGYAYGVYERTPGLLKASTEYQLDHLKIVCEKGLASAVNVQSVVSRFCLAEENDAQFLKNKCLDFIANNTRQVIQTPGWENFTKEKSELAIQVLEEIASNKW